MASSSSLSSTNVTKLHALFFAVESGNIRDTKRLLAMYGFQSVLPLSSASGTTVLHKAALCKNSELMGLLLSFGTINIDALEDRINGGYGAIHVCCQQNNAPCLQEIIRAGANVNLKAGGKLGETPLHICCKLGYEDCARILIQQGADTNASDGFGHSPSFWAYSLRHMDMILTLGLPPPRVASASEHMAVTGIVSLSVKKKKGGGKKGGAGKKKK